MSTLNVKIPDEMEDDLQNFLEEHPYYLNKSELVRDALRHLIESRELSARAREDIQVSCEQIEAGDTVALDKLRVGDYRVIADWDRAEDKVYVLTVEHRRNIYDRDW